MFMNGKSCLIPLLSLIINKVPLYALKTLSITLGFQTEVIHKFFQIFFTDLGLVWFQEGLVSGSVKTSGFALGFQHFPRDLANLLHRSWFGLFDA